MRPADSSSFASNTSFDYDVAIIGSGFGGSVSAMRLSEKGYRVAIIEAGKRFEASDYPRNNWNLRKFIFAPKLGLRGIQRMTLLSDALVLSGAGVGGGSLVYANTLYEPPDTFFDDKQWAAMSDWKKELQPHYRQAKKMLGAAKAPDSNPNDLVLRGISEEMGVPETYTPTEVGVWFGSPGVRAEDPYFGGLGPERVGCIQCGACMIGCRHEAKNSLDKNYLYLAESSGADVFPNRLVTDLIEQPGGGFQLAAEDPNKWIKQKKITITAEQVIFSAGVLGTVKLLAELQNKGRLTNLSPRLGDLVRTNSESIVGATAKKADVDHSVGVAISSSIHPNSNTHIEGVRYPKGSNALGLIATTLVDGGGRFPRPLKFLCSILRHPLRFLKSLSVYRWSERSVILLVMQSYDNNIRLKWRSGGKRKVKLRSVSGVGEPNPTFIPEANEAARIAAKLIDGDAMGGINEALLDTPVTAHILGGCVIGEDSQTGVIDAYHRLFGHPGLHVIDASSISANLGVNPSLTICALAERAISMWPNFGEPDQRPQLGSQYRQLNRIAPHYPIVPVGAPGSLS